MAPRGGRGKTSSLTRAFLPAAIQQNTFRGESNGLGSHDLLGFRTLRLLIMRLA